MFYQVAMTVYGVQERTKRAQWTIDILSAVNILFLLLLLVPSTFLLMKSAVLLLNRK